MKARLYTSILKFSLNTFGALACVLFILSFTNAFATSNGDGPEGSSIGNEKCMNGFGEETSSQAHSDKLFALEGDGSIDSPYIVPADSEMSLVDRYGLAIRAFQPRVLIDLLKSGNQLKTLESRIAFSESVYFDFGTHKSKPRRISLEKLLDEVNDLIEGQPYRVRVKVGNQPGEITPFFNILAALFSPLGVMLNLRDSNSTFETLVYQVQSFSSFFRSAFTELKDSTNSTHPLVDTILGESIVFVYYSGSAVSRSKLLKEKQNRAFMEWVDGGMNSESIPKGLHNLIGSVVFPSMTWTATPVVSSFEQLAILTSLIKSFSEHLSNFQVGLVEAEAQHFVSPLHGDLPYVSFFPDRLLYKFLFLDKGTNGFGGNDLLDLYEKSAVNPSLGERLSLKIGNTKFSAAAIRFALSMRLMQSLIAGDLPLSSRLKDKFKSIVAKPSGSSSIPRVNALYSVLNQYLEEMRSLVRGHDNHSEYSLAGAPVRRIEWNPQDSKPLSTVEDGTIYIDQGSGSINSTEGDAYNLFLERLNASWDVKALLDQKSWRRRLLGKSESVTDKFRVERIEREFAFNVLNEDGSSLSTTLEDFFGVKSKPIKLPFPEGLKHLLKDHFNHLGTKPSMERKVQILLPPDLVGKTSLNAEDFQLIFDQLLYLLEVSDKNLSVEIINHPVADLRKQLSLREHIYIVRNSAFRSVEKKILKGSKSFSEMDPLGIKPVFSFFDSSLKYHDYYPSFLDILQLLSLDRSYFNLTHGKRGIVESYLRFFVRKSELSNHPLIGDAGRKEVLSALWIELNLKSDDDLQNRLGLNVGQNEFEKFRSNFVSQILNRPVTSGNLFFFDMNSMSEDEKKYARATLTEIDRTYNASDRENDPDRTFVALVIDGDKLYSSYSYLRRKTDHQLIDGTSDETVGGSPAGLNEVQSGPKVGDDVADFSRALKESVLRHRDYPGKVALLKLSWIMSKDLQLDFGGDRLEKMNGREALGRLSELEYQAMYGESKPDPEKLGLMGRQDFFGVSATLTRFLERSFKFRRVGNDELSTVLARYEIPEVLDYFSPEELSYGLAAFNARNKMGADLGKLVPSYGQLGNNSSVRSESPRQQVDLDKSLTGLVKAVVEPLGTSGLEDLDLDYDALYELMLKRLRVRYKTDVAGILAEIGRLTESLSENGTAFKVTPEMRQNLKEVAERLEEKFSNFKPIEEGIAGFNKKPLAHQVEAISFLAARTGAILADDTGLGKTLSALMADEVVGSRKTVIVTRAANRQNIRNEILKHRTGLTDDDILVLEGLTPEERASKLRNFTGRYIIVSYHMLNFFTDNEFDSLNQSLDTLILDEGHNIENEETLKRESVLRIVADRILYLSATPYQIDHRNLLNIMKMLVPSKFSTVDPENYFNTAEGLKSFRRLISNYLLQRRREEAVKTFTNPAESGKSLSEQIAENGALIPAVEREPDIRAELLFEQTAAIAQIRSGGFPKFIKAVNAKVNPEDPYSNDANALNILNWIRNVTYLPKSAGIVTETDPVIDAIDSRVRKALDEEDLKKVVIFTWNVEMLNQLYKKYEAVGARTLSGETKDLPWGSRQQAVNDFKDREDVKVFIVNYGAGGEGLSLYADLAIFAQIPPKIAGLIQTTGRVARITGMEDVEHARDKVRIAYVVPTHRESDLEALQQRYEAYQGIVGYLRSNGSLTQELMGRLEGGRVIYDMVIRGYSTEEALEAYFTAEILNRLIVK